ERLSFEQFHDHIVSSGFIRSCIRDSDHRRMADRRKDERLPSKSSSNRGIRGELGTQYLKRDFFSCLHVARREDRAHPSGPELPVDDEAPRKQLTSLRVPLGITLEGALAICSHCYNCWLASSFRSTCTAAAMNQLQ